MRKDIVQEVCNIAVKAGEEIMKIYNDASDFSVESKADNSPLTIADKASNDVINVGLKNLDVIYPIISEENPDIEYEVRKVYNRFWLVDPLDGTKEFIKRNGEFTVNIALIDSGYPIMGVVYIPATEELYYSCSGEGAYKRRGDQVTKISCKRFTIHDESLNVVCSRSHINEPTQNFLDALKKPNIVSRGSSLKFLIMADGKADIYPRLGPTMEWDTGAAQAILEEAGGVVVHSETYERLNYNKPSLLNPYFLAAGKVSGSLKI